MKNKILLVIATMLVIMVISVRYLFVRKFDEFKNNISIYESEQIVNLLKEKESRITTLSNGDKRILQLFSEQFDESKSITIKDTSFSFLYLRKSLKYRKASLGYIDCLHNKCVIDKQNEAMQKLISAKEDELEKKFGKTFSHWYSKLKGQKLLKETKKLSDCSNFFPAISEISFNENAWCDFERFMIVFNNEIKESKMQNQKVENQYANVVASTKKQLRSGVISYFEEKLSNRKTQIISTQIETKTYDSPTLGLITYSVNRIIFDNSTFQNVADDAFEEQWKHNSLRTGAMPYSSCYGSSNYCGDWSCSKIKVITGGSDDVLVSIKNHNGRVVRHAYIRGGNSYTFNVSNGSYQVFFYSGKGWNPKKVMQSATCNSLKGGFVLNESVTKDSYIVIFGQIMTYELILQNDGNLQTQPSSKSEAF